MIHGGAAQQQIVIYAPGSTKGLSSYAEIKWNRTSGSTMEYVKIIDVTLKNFDDVTLSRAIWDNSFISNGIQFIQSTCIAYGWYDNNLNRQAILFRKKENSMICDPGII